MEHKGFQLHLVALLAAASLSVVSAWPSFCYSNCGSQAYPYFGPVPGQGVWCQCCDNDCWGLQGSCISQGKATFSPGLFQLSILSYLSHTAEAHLILAKQLVYEVLGYGSVHCTGSSGGGASGFSVSGQTASLQPGIVQRVQSVADMYLPCCFNIWLSFLSFPFNYSLFPFSLLIASLDVKQMLTLSVVSEVVE